MTEAKPDLIAKYLAGQANADDVEQLNQALADDPQLADELMSEALLDVDLQQALSRDARGPITAILPPTPSSNSVWQWMPISWTSTLLLAVGIFGWTMTAYLAGQLGQARDDLGQARDDIDAQVSRIAELEQALDGPLLADSDAPEIHSVRGWLMALPEDGGTEGDTLLVGTAAPLDQRLWTCPWGGAEFRYESDLSIWVERNTTVKFNETDELRRVTLESGIVHVTNLSETDHRPTEIETELATVRLIHGQVAVQVDDARTSVEAAVDQVEVFVDEQGTNRTYKVRRGQYLVIEPGKRAKVTQGMMELGLEPPNK